MCIRCIYLFILLFSTVNGNLLNITEYSLENFTSTTNYPFATFLSQIICNFDTKTIYIYMETSVNIDFVSKMLRESHRQCLTSIIILVR